LVTGPDGQEQIHFHDWNGKLDLDGRELAMLIPLVVITIFLGIYPMPIMGLMTTTVNHLVEVLSPVMMAVVN
ncbi:NADH-quinone oxidoreductase subunit M, partial [Chlorobium phaeovibrioides]|nr:NADH-quinone oxidoreductase subunit M [Chlorobium phaeovibrioides]